MDCAVPAPERTIASRPLTGTTAGIEEQTGAPSANPERRRRTALTSLRALVALLALWAVTLVLTLFGQPKPAASYLAPSNLGLAARMDGTQIVLSWNRQAEAILNADEASLSIRDGAQHEDIPVDLTVLRTRSLAYAPVSRDVTVQLQVKNHKNLVPAVESVRILIRTRDAAAATGW
jgi:hypothetical protein